MAKLSDGMKPLCGASISTLHLVVAFGVTFALTFVFAFALKLTFVFAFALVVVLLRLRSMRVLYASANAAFNANTR